MISTTTRLATLATLLLPLVSATFSFNTSIVDDSYDYSISPSWGVSGPCATAYSADISCESSLVEQSSVTPGERPAFCTNKCLDGLRQWRDSIREKCTTDDIKAATSQLNNTGSTIFDSDGPVGAQVLASIADPKIPVVEALYFVYCMKDLKTGELCPLTNEDTAPKDNATYCANTCLTQIAVYTYDLGTQLYGGSDDFIGSDIRTMCPGLDTSQYPMILSQKSASSYSFDSPSTTSGGASNTTDTGAKKTDTPNSAASLKGSLWGMGGIVAAVAMGVFVL